MQVRPSHGALQSEHLHNLINTRFMAVSSLTDMAL
jgi:hypothetical protein